MTRDLDRSAIALTLVGLLMVAHASLTPISRGQGKFHGSTLSERCLRDKRDRHYQRGLDRSTTRVEGMSGPCPTPGTSHALAVCAKNTSRASDLRCSPDSSVRGSASGWWPSRPGPQRWLATRPKRAGKTSRQAAERWSMATCRVVSSLVVMGGAISYPGCECGKRMRKRTVGWAFRVPIARERSGHGAEWQPNHPGSTGERTGSWTDAATHLAGSASAGSW